MDERDWHRHYAPGVPRALDYDGCTIPGALWRSAAAYPDAIAIVFGPGRIRYTRLLEWVEREVVDRNAGIDRRFALAKFESGPLSRRG